MNRQTITIARRLLSGGASLAALILADPAILRAQSLQPSYSPAADNGGGSQASRADVITVTNGAGTITGDYNLLGTSARRFVFDNDTIATRNANGEVIAGYDAVAGRSSVMLSAQQKTTSATYPDQIQGSRRATLVYDNDRLAAVASTDTRTTTYVDTGAPVYGDLRLANIAKSAVTIATGNTAESIYDAANFAIPTADSGSTLYNVTTGSSIVYASRTATMDGADQNGLSQPDRATVAVPVTRYSGTAFDVNDAVTDLAALKRYNTSLIAQLNAGTITPDQYEARIQAAATTTTSSVTVRTPQIPTYTAPPTISERLFIKLDRSTLTTTAASQLVGVVGADGNNDGLSTLILAQNGSTIVNNGSIASAEGGVGIRVKDAGSSLTNSATGVIGIGYETLDRSGATPVPTGNTDLLGTATANIAVRATDSAAVVNQGIVNVANRDIANHPENPSYGKANTGIAVSSGATASNGGTILIGGAGSAVANTLGLFGGAAGLEADGGTATNTAQGTIRVGTTFAASAADLAGLVDVMSVNYAAGMTSLSGGGTLVNEGLIRIGALAQNASGMLVGSDGSTGLNAGQIVIDPSTTAGPSARNVGIAVRGSSVAGAVEATNAASGTITVSGGNDVALLVDNGVAGGSARAVNAGTIAVNGGISFDGLRNYGIYVANATSSAAQNGAVILRGAGTIGVHARNGGTIDIGAGGSVDFQGANQIGYYLLGFGSRITGASTLAVDTAGSTGIRVEDGATLTGIGLVIAVSGTNAFGIVGSGASSGTTVDTSGSRLTVSGAGATGVLIEGGATGVLSGLGTIALTGNGTVAAIVDGQEHTLDGAVTGAPTAATSLASNAALTASADSLTGYIARNGGQLVHGGAIAFTGADSTGILVTTGASASNTGTIMVAAGTGIRVDGAGSTLTGAGDASVGTGIAALALVNGASVTSSGSFSAGGTANGVLLSTGAGSLTLAAGTITASGSGNGIENAAGSAIRLNGTSVVASGTGAAVHTGVALDLASVATLAATGGNSTGFDYSGTGGARVASKLALGTGLTITASGAGATGARLATTGTVTLGGTLRVTSAEGGSALVAGPAASIINTGTIASASTAAPAVDLTGGTLAFNNGGTIAAASPIAVAIGGGGNGQAVTFTAGAVTGAVQLGSGNDTFLMTGGTFTGALSAGEGNDSVTFRGLSDANLGGVTRIAGDGTASGADTLIFDATQSTGTRRITGFNTVTLVSGSTLTADGNLTLAGGTVAINSSSTFYAGNGVGAVIAPGTGGTLAVVNAGTIDLTNGGNGAGDTLTIRGNYVGQNGTLKLQTVLGSATSLSDRLVIDGGRVSGTTTIQIADVGGLGAATTGNGIEVIGAINGAQTTATTTRTGFALAGTHVDAGAFEYRLYASDLAGTSESWFLRTQAAVAPATPSTPVVAVPTYRVEVPLLAALPVQLRDTDLTMLATYHKRMGDQDCAVASGFTVPGRFWGRFIAEQERTRQGGDARPMTDGHLYGGQLGVDLLRFGSAAGHHDIGIYGGYLDRRAQVNGFASGTDITYAGRLDPTARYAGIYWTYQADRGFYADTVVQLSHYGGSALVANGGRIGIRGNGVLASVETGYPVALSRIWSIEPQVQLIGQGVSIDSVTIYNATVAQHTPGYLTGRLGLRLKGRYSTSAGALQPYLRANVWKGFRSTDRTLFTTDVATTAIATPSSSLWGEGGTGLTWTLRRGLDLYGEGDYRFTLDEGQGVLGRSISGSIGLKLSL